MRYELLLLLLCSVSFALIDPPIDSVHEHNLAIAPEGILNENVLGYEERTPTMNDPTTFLYAKILTLTPSVNLTINSKRHPQLIWLVAGGQENTIEERWNTSEACPESYRIRNFEPMELRSITATYYAHGFLKKEDNNYTYVTENATQRLDHFDNATNTTDFENAVNIPFEKPFISSCDVIDFISKYLLAGLFNLDCYEPTLERASPYATGTYNLTVRNLTIVEPTVDVGLEAVFEINYTQEGREYYEEEGHCEYDDFEGDGSIILSRYDNATYTIQNDYMTIIPYSPNFPSLDANTSEDVIYHISLLANSELYKYYSVIDNKTATAYYLYNFSVENDSYGMQTIVAHRIDKTGALEDDPEITDVYTGKHSLLVKMSGDYLRSPQEITNISYNHSKVYQIKDVFYDVSPGAHHVDLKFFTYFGNYTAGSDINVRIATTLTVQAQQIGNDRIMVFCSLMGNKTPLAGQPIELVIGDDEITVMTDGLGQCTNIFETNESVGSATAKYPGSETYLPSVSTYPFATAKGFDLGGDLIINNFGLLFFVSLLFAFSVMNLIHGFGYMFGGSVLADALKKFLPFPPGGISKGMKLTGKTKEKEGASSLTGTMAGSDDKKNKEKEAAKKAAESEMKKRIAEQQKADERKKPEKKDNKWADYESRRKKAMLETEEKKALVVVVKKGDQEPEKIAVATSENAKKAEEESRGKELAKRGIEEGDKDAVIAGLVRRREEDRYIKVFDTEMRQMRETEHQRQKYETKEAHLQPDVNAGRINKDERELVARTHEIDRVKLITTIDYGDIYEEGKMISSLHSRLEERKTEQWLRAQGFETKTEILPNPESEKTVDVVGRSKEERILRYKGIDDNGNETYKEDKIAQGKIVAIECKSYEEKDFYHLLRKKEHEGGWGQLRNSVSSKDVNQTYLSVTNDFNQLPYKERYEFAEKINGANAKLIIADHSAKDNKDEVGKIIEKLKKEKGD